MFLQYYHIAVEYIPILHSEDYRKKWNTKLFRHLKSRGQDNDVWLRSSLGEIWVGDFSDQILYHCATRTPTIVWGLSNLLVVGNVKRRVFSSVVCHLLNSTPKEICLAPSLIFPTGALRSFYLRGIRCHIVILWAYSSPLGWRLFLRIDWCEFCGLPLPSHCYCFVYLL